MNATDMAVQSADPAAGRLPSRAPPPPSGTVPRRISLLVAWPILLGVLVAATTLLLILQLRAHTLRQAEHEQQGRALMLANHAERAMEAVELVQTVLQERLQTATIRTPDEYRSRLSGADVRDELRSRARMLPQIDALVLVDAAGDVINYSRALPVPDPPINVADRDFFQALSVQPGRTSFVSEPMRTRSTGKWTMYIARKVESPDGVFLGLILGGLELTWFEDFYRSVANGPTNAIALFRRDGRLLARYPPASEVVGSALVGRSFEQLAPGGAVGAVTSGPSRVDGQQRLMAVRSLTHYPVFVNVTNTMSAILSEWRRQAAYLGIAAIILELMMAGAWLLVLRQIRAQRALVEARAARAEAEADLSVAAAHARASQAIGLQNMRFTAALRNMTQALCMFDADDRLVVGNPRLALMFGLPPACIVPGVSLDTLFAAARDAATLQPCDIETMRATIERLTTERMATAYVRELADGRCLAVTFAPTDDGGWLTTLEDVTDRRQVEAQIAHMAHHDTLTGLPNRVLFHSRLGEAVARGRRGEPGAVLYLDLDHFKAVNDTLGHPTGDALLRAVTQRLCAQVRETDIVARLGGDEFAIVQSGVQQPADATVLATRIIAAVGEPYEINGHRVIIGTSIGIAVVPGDGEDPDLILKNADLALYRAKADGRGTYAFFKPEMDALMQSRRTLELDLRKALGAGEFRLFYQPLMSLKSGALSGFEALLRWQHPERGMVSPADFVPFAEEIGLIVPLGRWALLQACSDAVRWPDAPKVAVNVSVIQFGSRTLVDDVLAALRESGLPASRLELEITEFVMLDDTETVLATLHELRSLGVGIAMDDFGTGYSSLSYLRRFPFNKVKIDRSFIDGLGKGDDCDAIVTAVIDLCGTLGMIALAEGVETEEQLRMLRAGGCAEAQGYLFSRPQPAAEVAAMCRRLGQPALTGATL